MLGLNLIEEVVAEPVGFDNWVGKRVETSNFTNGLEVGPEDNKLADLFGDSSTLVVGNTVGESVGS